MTSIAQKVLDEIIRQRMVTIAHPDPQVSHVFVWAPNAAEQLEAVIAAELEAAGRRRLQEDPS